MAKSVFMAFGRMQPPTRGHLVVINQLLDSARKVGGKAVLFLSNTQDTKKNPLTHDEKAKAVLAAAPSLIIGPKTAKSPIDALNWAKTNGYTAITLVVGTDRREKFGSLINSWKKYEDPDNKLLVKVAVADAGTRNSISGTAARQLALSGNLAGFTKMVIAPTMAKDLMQKIQSRLVESDSQFEFEFDDEDELTSLFEITLYEADDKDKKSPFPPKKKKDDKDKDDEDKDKDEKDDKSDDKDKKSPFPPKKSEKDDESEDDEDKGEDKVKKGKSPFPPKDGKDGAADDKKPKKRNTSEVESKDNPNADDGPVDSDIEGNDSILVFNPPEKLEYVLSNKLAAQKEKKTK